MKISRITDGEQKERIARGILEALTDWFEVSETREAYIRESRDQIFFEAEQEGQTIGFLCLKETSRCTVELAVMGVRKENHRQGAGKALVQAAKLYAATAGYDFMQVKTVQMGHYEDYDRTNRFYLEVGFKELEVFPAYWDEANPCQLYVLSLRNEVSLTELIMNRRSYRGKYKPDKVPRKDLAEIMKAGLAAPSGCNKQTTSLIAVDDEALLARLHQVIDPPVAQTAPAMICVLTQRINAYRDRCFATQDYSAAIENMLLAIAAMGYQSCWYEGHITDEDRIGNQIAGILGVPDKYELVCILPVGIAEGVPSVPEKRPFDERAWLNGYGAGFRYEE